LSGGGQVPGSAVPDRSTARESVGMERDGGRGGGTQKVT
jgi:hypothetical protein